MCLTPEGKMLKIGHWLTVNDNNKTVNKIFLCEFHNRYCT